MLDDALDQAVLAKYMDRGVHPLSRFDRVCLAVVVERPADLIALVITMLLAPAVETVGVENVRVRDHLSFSLVG